MLASNLSGPRRPSAGAARDHFLGFSAVNGLGEEFKAGGKVVKNVTGYDLPKLLAGSMGTLAVMLEVTVKVLPAPEKQRTVIVPVPDVATGHRCLTAQLQRSVRDRRRRLPAGCGRGALERRSGARAGSALAAHAPDGIAGLGRRSLRRPARRHRACRAKSCTACARSALWAEINEVAPLAAGGDWRALALVRAAGVGREDRGGAGGRARTG